MFSVGQIIRYYSQSLSLLVTLACASYSLLVNRKLSGATAQRMTSLRPPSELKCKGLQM